MSQVERLQYALNFIAAGVDEIRREIVAEKPDRKKCVRLARELARSANELLESLDK